ncbi:MAG: acyl-CoA dehydrogenase family protein [Desulfobacterales bacterium]|jgi:alkylation response protein AidB-like acyl-CoA dehydrogenase|nr:acyl-CoA dehydrogenase family protein [Desulfobacterales bacterium]
MMEFGLTGEQQKFLKEVAQFCEAECGAVPIEELEEKGVDPEALEAKIAAKGWYGLPYPKEYGGMGKGYFDIGLLIEELARGGYPYPGRLQLTTMIGLNILKNGTRSQKLNILPKVSRGESTLSISVTEPDSGSDIASLKTKAVENKGGYLLSGQKLYNSCSAGDKNTIMVAARTDATVPVHKGLTMFLVPANSPGLTFRRLHSMGRKIGGLYEVFFDDVRVPRESVLGEVNKGWAVLTGGFNVERAIISAGLIGFARRMFNDLLKNVNDRYGPSVNPERRGAVMCRVAEFASQIQAAKLLTDQALRSADKHDLSIETVCQCKIVGSELVKKLGDFCAEVAGGKGYLMSSLVQWYFRESRIVTIGGGSSQVMRNVAGAQLGLK